MSELFLLNVTTQPHAMRDLLFCYHLRLNGFGAKFVGSNQGSDNLIKVYLAPDESLQIKDASDTLDSLVKSLTESFIHGYLTALGLNDESLFQVTRKAMNKNSEFH